VARRCAVPRARATRDLSRRDLPSGRAFQL